MSESTPIRRCFTPKIDSNERELLVQLIKIVDSILTINHIDWIPIGGNSLSALRYQKLVLPWDDDFDMVVRKCKRKKALNILKRELPKYGCKIKLWSTWHKTKSKLYKISFNQDIEGVTPLYRKDKDFTFPFIDLFIYNKKDHPNRNGDIINYDKKLSSVTSLANEAVDLDILEYPLYEINCEGINVRVPTRGFRSIKSKKENKLLDICYDNPFSHKKGVKEGCLGLDTFECKRISALYD